MVETIYTGDYYCKTCVIGCGKKVRITHGRYNGVEGAAAEHETVGMLGALCLIDDLEEAIPKQTSSATAMVWILYPPETQLRLPWRHMKKG